jgi:hypothetical protein
MEFSSFCFGACALSVIGRKCGKWKNGFSNAISNVLIVLMGFLKITWTIEKNREEFLLCENF